MKYLFFPALLISGLIASGCSTNDSDEMASASTPSTAVSSDTAAQPVASSDNAEKASETLSGTPTDVTSTPASQSASRSIASEGKEGEVMAYLNAVNTHEIQAAGQAKTKNISKEVMDFVTALESEHTKNMQKTQTLSDSMSMTSMETPAVEDLKTRGSAELARLEALSGKDYETAFMQSMIKTHREVLGMIDSKLMAMTTSDAVKSHLEETRKHIASHLETAEEIESDL